MRGRLRALRKRYAREESILFFIGGFAFDAVMVGRIDETPVLIQQAAYLLMTGLLLAAMLYLERKGWEPPEWLRRPWKGAEPLLHFMLGTLLTPTSSPA